MARLGVTTASGACLAAIAYGVPQLLQAAGLLPDPLDRLLIFAPSLALAPLFVVAVAAVAARAAEDARAWRFAAAGLAVLYAACVGPVYVIQLGVVIPREVEGLAPVAGFACCGFRQPLTAVDLLGYTYMSVATLLLSPTYRGATRWWLVANGMVAVPLLLQLQWPQFLWLGAAWLVTFPVAMALVARAEAAPAA